MKREHPILFSGPLVHAILNGSKSQTRRVVKPQPPPETVHYFHVTASTDKTRHRRWVPRGRLDGRRPTSELGEALREAETGPPIRCPYGDPGDRLYVRESYCPRYFDDGRHAYRADWDGSASDVVPEPKWTPSIHMPKAAARIWLEVSEVSVERVQDITERDAQAEGVDRPVLYDPSEELGVQVHPYTGEYRDAFRALWDAINSNRPGCSWADNPWCWRISFKRVEETNASIGGGS